VRDSAFKNAMNVDGQLNNQKATKKKNIPSNVRCTHEKTLEMRIYKNVFFFHPPPSCNQGKNKK
jgi:hypothetical protein